MVGYSFQVNQQIAQYKTKLNSTFILLQTTYMTQLHLVNQFIHNLFQRFHVSSTDNIIFLTCLTGNSQNIGIKEVKPDNNAQLVAENIAQQLENRVSFRRAMKSTMTRAMKSGAKGIKTAVSGRLGGADMARTEFYSEGTIPLQTLRADIDYGFAEADTTYGKLGVKVWIYQGEVLPTKAKKEGSDK